MRFLQELVANRVLWTGVLAWFVAQLLKVVFTALLEKRLDFGRLFGLGGMPSSHSAVVCSLATSTGMMRGFYSVEFAICCLLAMVVMTDAAGVRRAAGRQAVLLNKILQDMIANGRGLSNEKLKELLGHTPFEVLIGALLGILIGLLAV